MSAGRLVIEGDIETAIKELTTNNYLTGATTSFVNEETKNKKPKGKG